MRGFWRIRCVSSQFTNSARRTTDQVANVSAMSRMNGTSARVCRTAGRRNMGGSIEEEHKKAGFEARLSIVRSSVRRVLSWSPRTFLVDREKFLLKMYATAMQTHKKGAGRHGWSSLLFHHC